MKQVPCNRCGQPVWWGTNAASGKSMPVNTWTSKSGKIVALDPEADRPIIRFLHKGEEVPEATKRYVSHFTTCKRGRR